MDESMTDCGLSDEEKASVYRVTAAVLHIGNVLLEEAGDGTAVQADSKPTLEGISTMIGLSAEALEKAICFKTINIGGEISDKGLSLEMAEYGKNALAKSIYSKLFDWIVASASSYLDLVRALYVLYGVKYIDLVSLALVSGPLQQVLPVPKGKRRRLHWCVILNRDCCSFNVTPFF